MKEMIYKPERKLEILDEGIYNDYHYVIVSHGTHPCAYVEIPENHPYYCKDWYKCDIDVHGGITFGADLSTCSEEFFADPKYDKFYLGWDYAHFDDCICNPWVSSDGKKWTTEEMLKDVKSVIRQLKKLELK